MDELVGGDSAEVRGRDGEEGLFPPRKYFNGSGERLVASGKPDCCEPL